MSIVAVDQLTKAWAVSALADGPKHAIGDFLVFDLSRNSGSAFSRFQGYTPVLAVLAIVIASFVARALRQATDSWTLVGLVLVLGGALGNLADRLARSPGFLRGHVVDFVAVGWWPVFNVADSCITIGAIVLIVRTLFAPTSCAGTVIEGPIIVPAALDGDRVDRAISFLTGWPRAAVQELIDAGAVTVDGRVVAKEPSSARGERASRYSPSRRSSPTRGRSPIPAWCSTCASRTTTSWSSPSPPVSSCIRVRGTRGERSSTACSPGFRVSSTSAIRCARASSTGSIATRADCSSWRERLGPTTRSSRELRSVRSIAATAHSCGDACRHPRGVIDAPIGRSGARRHTHGGTRRGKPARTAYKVVDEFDVPLLSLLECKLETGRTHQIRVHLAAIGHPIVGDGTYGGSRDQIALPRPFLHAGTLGFDHPVTGERLRFEEPLPVELREVLDHLLGGRG